MVTLRGFTNHKGVAKGKAKIVSSKSDLKNVRIGSIVVVESMDREFITAFFRASAVLIESESTTTRDALIARQLDIPMITGVKNLMSTVRNDSFVMVNGNTGEVFID